MSKVSSSIWKKSDFNLNCLPPQCTISMEGPPFQNLCLDLAATGSLWQLWKSLIFMFQALISIPYHFSKLLTLLSNACLTQHCNLSYLLEQHRSSSSGNDFLAWLVAKSSISRVSLGFFGLAIALALAFLSISIVQH